MFALLVVVVAATLGNSLWNVMDIFIHCNSFHFAGIGSSPPPLSLTSHITSACVCSRWRHHVSSLRGLWIQNALRHRLCAFGATCFFVFFPLFPSPVAATSCRVVTGDDFVCWLVGWRHSQGLCYTTGMLGKLLSLVPWNGLQWLNCRLF